jgi:hypothetical protein
MQAILRQDAPDFPTPGGVRQWFPLSGEDSANRFQIRLISPSLYRPLTGPAPYQLSHLARADCAGPPSPPPRWVSLASFSARPQLHRGQACLGGPEMALSPRPLPGRSHCFIANDAQDWQGLDHVEDPAIASAPTTASGYVFYLSGRRTAAAFDRYLITPGVFSIPFSAAKAIGWNPPSPALPWNSCPKSIRSTSLSCFAIGRFGEARAIPFRRPGGPAELFPAAARRSS